MTTYPVSDSEMEYISNLSGQVTTRFSIASLLLALAAGIWTNALFYSEFTPIAYLAMVLVAPLFLVGSIGFAVAGFIARHTRTNLWDRIRADAEPVQSVAEAGGLMISGNRTMTGRSKGHD